MKVLGEQLKLELDTEEHLEVLHEGHRALVCVASSTTRADWKDTTCQHSEARELVGDLVQDAGKNIYISQSGFDGKRCVSDVSVLPALFVDLDYYKDPNLRGKEPEEVLEIILRKQTWMPQPSLLADSGRGMYLLWLLEPPLGRDRLPDWQATETLLISRLVPYGADWSARDAARVLRLCGSVNQRSGKKVSYKRVGAKIPFTEIQAAVLKHCRCQLPEAEQKPTRPRLVADNPSIKTRPTTTRQVAISGDVTFLFNGLSLAYARMCDLRAVAGMRVPLKDRRRRFLFCFAVCVSWYCPTQEAMERELSLFVQTFFKDPQNYSIGIVRNIIKKVGGARYRLTNRTIIGMLNISQFEQSRLKTLIDIHHVWQRKEAKRRAEGVLPRDEYLARYSAKSQARKQEALRLRKRGFTQAKIAEEMGISLRSVKYYLKKT